jgi:hypothetical protein
VRGRHNPVTFEEFRMDSSLFDAIQIEGGRAGAYCQKSDKCEMVNGMIGVVATYRAIAS